MGAKGAHGVFVIPCIPVRSSTKERTMVPTQDAYKLRKDIIGTCANTACNGEIMLEVSFNNTSNLIGGTPRMIAHDECYCTKCGCLYKKEIVRARAQA